MSERDLSDRVALLTGASSGIGFASARALAQRGARLAIASRGGPKLERACRELAASGAEVAGFAADVRSFPALDHLVDQVEERFGRIDVLVANGGGPPAKAALELDEEDWQDAIALCLLFVPRLCRRVLPGMLERGWGRIVAINSVSSRQPIPGLALSNTLRPGVLGYLKTLAQEVADRGVTINSVLPGHTRTDRQEELAEARARATGKQPEELIASWAADIPAGRLAEPAEIGSVVAFLCSPGASFVTSQAITVDGGYVRSLM